MDSRTFFFYKTLLDAGVDHAGTTSAKVSAAFARNRHWETSETGRRDVRQDVTFVVCEEVDIPERVTPIVDKLLASRKGAQALEQA